MAPSNACYPTQCRVPEEGMVEMGCLDTMESLDAMVGMEPQEDRERRVTLVYRDHLDYEVCNLTDAESRDEYEQFN